MEIKEIVKKVLAGEMHRGIDEAHTGGFWDLAEEIQNNIANDKDIDPVSELYYTFYAIAEACANKDFSGDNE